MKNLMSEKNDEKRRYNKQVNAVNSDHVKEFDPSSFGSYKLIKYLIYNDFFDNL